MGPGALDGVAAVVLGGVFVSAGLSKLVRPDALRTAINTVTRRRAHRSLVPAIASAEILLGIGILSGVEAQLVAAFAIVALVGLSFALMVFARRGVACGCLGHPDGAPARGLARNAGLAICAAAIVAGSGPAPWWNAGSETVLADMTAALGAICLWACAAAVVTTSSLRAGEATP